MNKWNGLWKIGGAAALICAGMYFVALGVELPAYRVGPPPATVLEWFSLFLTHPLTGLFFLGLADILITILWGPIALALYTVIKPSNQTWAAIAAVFVFVGMAVYLATNQAFSMLFLSQQYGAATTETQKSAFLAAGQAMIAETEGARMLLLVPLAGLTFSILLLRSGIFSRVTAWTGILGLGLLSASGLFAGYATTGSMTTARSMMVGITYAGGGVLSLVWYVLTGLQLLKLR